MPTSVKDQNVTPADSENVVGVCFPKELYIPVIIEDAERELVEKARRLTRDLLAGGRPIGE